MDTQRVPTPPPHRLHYLAVGLTLLAVLAIGAVIAAVVANGNNKPKPTVTHISAGAIRQMASSSVATAVRFENTTISVLVPGAGWSGAKTATTLTLLPPSKVGINTYQSGRFSGGVVQLFQAVANKFARGYQSPEVCGKPAAQRVPNGPPGVIFALCGTYVPQNGQALPVVQLATIGTQRGVGVGVFFITDANNAKLKRLITETGPVYRSVHWKLLG
jgi:hypothetical protein